MYLHSSLTSALCGSEWSASRLGRITPEKATLFPLVRSLYGARAGLDGFREDKIFPTGNRTLDGTARSCAGPANIPGLRVSKMGVLEAGHN